MPPKAKLTVAQSYAKAKQTVSKTADAKPTPGSAAANRAAFMSGPKAIVKFFAEGGISGNSKPAAAKTTSTVPPNPPKSGRGMVAAPPGARKGAKAAGIGAPKPAAVVAPVVKGRGGPPASTTTTTTTTTAKAAKPYTKLKQAPREAARRAYVQKQLDRLGIKPSAAGKPRSAKEKAARVKARATWDKKNKFQKKSGPQSGGSGSMENRPEA